MNLPGVVVDLPTLTDKDKEDLVKWGIKNQVDFIAASFVRKGADLDNIRAVLGEEGASIHIISKIENQEGIQNFETVLQKSDGIMVRLPAFLAACRECASRAPCTNSCNVQKLLVWACQHLPSRASQFRIVLFRAHCKHVAHTVHLFEPVHINLIF